MRRPRGRYWRYDKGQCDRTCGASYPLCRAGLADLPAPDSARGGVATFVVPQEGPGEVRPSMTPERVEMGLT